MRLLLIEDDKDLATSITEQVGTRFALDWAETGKCGFYMAQTISYDLIILDLGLPDITGLELCIKLRADEIRTPILVLTADFKLDSKVIALDSGADDYMTKPFQFAELQARIRSLIRRGSSLILSAKLSFGELSMDTASRIIHYQGEQFYLKRKEFDILEVFLRNTDTIVSRSMLLERVWNGDTNDLSNSVDVHVGRLRKRMQQILGRQIITTIYGFGYRLDSSPFLSIDPFSVLVEST